MRRPPHLTDVSGETVARHNLHVFCSGTRAADIVQQRNIFLFGGPRRAHRQILPWGCAKLDAVAGRLERNASFIGFRRVSQPKRTIFISVQDVSGETRVAQQLCWMSRAIRWVAKWTPPGKTIFLLVVLGVCGKIFLHMAPLGEASNFAGSLKRNTRV